MSTMKTTIPRQQPTIRPSRRVRIDWMMLRPDIPSASASGFGPIASNVRTSVHRDVANELVGAKILPPFPKHTYVLDRVERMVDDVVTVQAGVFAALPRYQHRVRLDVLDRDLQDERHVAELLRFHRQQQLALYLSRLLAPHVVVAAGPLPVVAQPLPQLLRVARTDERIICGKGMTQRRSSVESVDGETIATGFRVRFATNLRNGTIGSQKSMRLERFECPEGRILEVVLAQIERGEGTERPKRVGRDRHQPVPVEVQLLQGAEMPERVLVYPLELVGGGVEHAQLLQILRELVQLADAVGGEVERLEQAQPLQALLRQQLELVHAQIEQLQAGEGDERTGRDAVDAVVGEMQPLDGRVQLEVLAGHDREVRPADDELAQMGKPLLVGIGRDALERIAGQVEPGEPCERRLGQGEVRDAPEPVQRQIDPLQADRVLEEVLRQGEQQVAAQIERVEVRQRVDGEPTDRRDAVRVQIERAQVRQAAQLVEIDRGKLVAGERQHLQRGDVQQREMRKINQPVPMQPELLEHVQSGERTPLQHPQLVLAQIQPDEVDVALQNTRREIIRRQAQRPHRTSIQRPQLTAEQIVLFQRQLGQVRKPTERTRLEPSQVAAAQIDARHGQARLQGVRTEHLQVVVAQIERTKATQRTEHVRAERPEQVVRQLELLQLGEPAEQLERQIGQPVPAQIEQLQPSERIERAGFEREQRVVPQVQLLQVHRLGEQGPIERPELVMLEPHHLHARLAAESLRVQMPQRVAAELYREEGRLAGPTEQLLRHRVTLRADQPTVRRHRHQRRMGWLVAATGKHRLQLLQLVVLQVYVLQLGAPSQRTPLDHGQLVLLQVQLHQIDRRCEQPRPDLPQTVPVQAQLAQLRLPPEQRLIQLEQHVVAEKQLLQVVQRAERFPIEPLERIVLQVQHLHTGRVREAVHRQLEQVVLAEEHLPQHRQVREHAAHVVHMVPAQVDRVQPPVRRKHLRIEVNQPVVAQIERLQLVQRHERVPVHRLDEVVVQRERLQVRKRTEDVRVQLGEVVQAEVEKRERPEPGVAVVRLERRDFVRRQPHQAQVFQLAERERRKLPQPVLGQIQLGQRLLQTGERVHRYALDLVAL
uniref:Uncharacterized protein n=1 Tax=Anopheles farauti TaxID=69004 RepID=A0A182Q6U2_9DIPT